MSPVGASMYCSTHPPKGNRKRFRISVIHATRTAHHAFKGSLAQQHRRRPLRRRKAIQNNPPILKSESLWVQRPRPTHVHSHATRARRGRQGENAVASASVCHWQRRSGTRFHSCRSAAPPAACRRQLKTEAGANMKWWLGGAEVLKRYKANERFAPPRSEVQQQSQGWQSKYKRRNNATPHSAKRRDLLVFSFCFPY